MNATSRSASSARRARVVRTSTRSPRPSSFGSTSPASSLPDEVKRDWRHRGNRILADGRLLIQAHEHRTQNQNREAARRRLMVLVQQAARRPKPRRETRPTTASRERRLTPNGGGGGEAVAGRGPEKTSKKKRKEQLQHSAAGFCGSANRSAADS